MGTHTYRDRANVITVDLYRCVHVCKRTSSVLKNNSMGQEMSDEEIQMTAAMARLRRLLIRGCSGLIMATYL